MKLSDAIVYILENNASVAGVIGTRVYPDAYPTNLPLPGITFTVDNITITEHKDGYTDWDDVDVTFTLLTKTRTAGELLSGYVRTAISRYSGTVGTTGVTFHTANHRGESWDYDRDSSRWETTDKGRGICITELNFRLAVK